MKLTDHDRYHVQRTGTEKKLDWDVHKSGDLLTIPFAPFIRGVVIDAGLRGASRFGTIIFDTSHFLENFLKNEQSLFRIVGHEEGGF